MGNYGNGTIQPATQPDAKPAGIVDTGDAFHFWFAGNGVSPRPMSRVLVGLLDTSDTRLLVKWNAQASASSWDEVVEPGDCKMSPFGIKVSEVGIYSDGGPATFGTEYTVQGWD